MISSCLYICTLHKHQCVQQPFVVVAVMVTIFGFHHDFVLFGLK